jgi:hypothetical protein
MKYRSDSSKLVSFYVSLKHTSLCKHASLLQIICTYKFVMF